MNNTSMFTADRMTHIKIVVVALVCATVVAGIGVASRVSDGSTMGSLGPLSDELAFRKKPFRSARFGEFISALCS